MLVGLLALSQWLLVAFKGTDGLGGTAWLKALFRIVPEFGLPGFAISAIAIVALYGWLKFVGRRRPAFWLVVILVLVPHIPYIWANNLIPWQRFMGYQFYSADFGLLFRTIAFFLISIVGLVCLHQIVAYRKLASLMASLRVEEGERARVLTNEAWCLAVLVAVALAATLTATLVGVLPGVPNP